MVHLLIRIIYSPFLVWQDQAWCYTSSKRKWIHQIGLEQSHGSRLAAERCHGCGYLSDNLWYNWAMLQVSTEKVIISISLWKLTVLPLLFQLAFRGSQGRKKGKLFLASIEIHLWRVSSRFDIRMASGSHHCISQQKQLCRPREAIGRVPQKSFDQWDKYSCSRHKLCQEQDLFSTRFLGEKDIRPNPFICSSCIKARRSRWIIIDHLGGYIWSNLLAQYC